MHAPPRKIVKEKKRALKEENDRQSILHEIFNNGQLLHQKHHHTHAQITRETKNVRPLFWPSGYLLTIPNNLEQSGRFCQSKLLRGNGSVGWPRYASHACTSNTIVLSARLAEYYRSRASIIIFRKSSD